MNRRSFCAASLSALLVPLSGQYGIWAPVQEFASPERDIECSQDQMGRRYCTAGVKSFTAQKFAQQQYMLQWCWAASISMIFQHYGHPVAQARIVSDAYGGIVNMPGGPLQILGSLNRQWVDDNGVVFWATANTVTANNTTAIDDLSNNHPLLIGALSHAVVLTALTFYPTMQGPRVVDAIVRDPFPTVPSRRSLTTQEWNNTSFGARIRVQ